MKTVDLSQKIFVAGHKGLVGGATLRSLQRAGATQIITRTRTELDLTSQSAVEEFFKKEKPQYVILAAAKVGGIHANNTYKGDFILENLEIQNNVIGAAFKNSVEKLIFLGSSCIYPKLAPQPIPENSLLTGPLEPTNDAYAIAKISGLWLCRALMQQYKSRFISVMPTNVYGPGDRYDENDSHVLPALLMKFHKAKTQKASFVTAWGSGTPLREFIHCDDLGDAIVHCLKHYEDAEHINLGSGQEVTIKKLTELVKEVVGFQGEIQWDSSKPDGTPRKLMDSSKIKALGWSAKIQLKDGIQSAYEDFLKRFA